MAKNWMSLALALLVAGHHNAEAACSFSTTFGTNSGSIDTTGTANNFNVAAGAATTCSLSSNGGNNCRVQLRYGATPNDFFNDGNRAEGECTFVVSATSGSLETVLGYRVIANNFANLQMVCTCTETADPPTPCFSATSLVQVEGKGATYMQDLQVGDKVLTGDNTYKPVYTWGHRDEELTAKFLQIYTEEGKRPMELTGRHLLFVIDQDGKRKAIRADEAKVGDQVVPAPSAGSENAVSVPVHIQKIQFIVRKGAYMPLTTDGTIVVDDLVASSYVSIQEDAPKVVENTRYFNLNEQSLAHWWMSPYRMFCMGVSPKYCDAKDNGINRWMEGGRQMAKLAEPYGFFGRVVVYGGINFAFFAFFNLVEFLFLGPALAPLGLFLIGSLAYYYNRRRNTQGSDMTAKKTV